MKQIACIFFLFIFSCEVFADEYAVPFSKAKIVVADEPVAVVLGAGPAGLLAARMILKANRHQQVLIVENRENFSRFNLVNIFPESWPMLRELNVLEAFLKVAIPVDAFRFYFERIGEPLFSCEPDLKNAPSSFDYRGKVATIFSQPQIGFHVVNLAALQKALSDFLMQDHRVKFIYGEAEISAPTAYGEMHSLKINFKDQPTNPLVFEPDLVVIAEGAHSKNRARLNIEIKPVLKKQLWCSGSVSLEGHRNNPKKITQVLEKTKIDKTPVRTFGVFQVRPSELFVNGEAQPEESVDECLKRNATRLINAVQKADNAPEGKVKPENLVVVKKSPHIIEIESSKAARAYSGNNVILIGDAAGFGTPKGGIGLSLATSVYLQALSDLLHRWNGPLREHALLDYNDRVSEIVDYWHSKIASAELVL